MQRRERSFFFGCKDKKTNHNNERMMPADDLEKISCKVIIHNSESRRIPWDWLGFTTPTFAAPFSRSKHIFLTKVIILCHKTITFLWPDSITFIQNICFERDNGAAKFLLNFLCSYLVSPTSQFWRLFPYWCCALLRSTRQKQNSAR